jgi:hypothetical protein
VQALVTVALGLIVSAIFVSITMLLYAPAIGVLLVGIWNAADSAELTRWCARIAGSAVSDDALASMLKARSDVPQRTMAGMLESLHQISPTSRFMTSSLGLVLALGFAARALEVRSGWWLIGSAFGLLLILAQRFSN